MGGRRWPGRLLVVACTMLPGAAQGQEPPAPPSPPVASRRGFKLGVVDTCDLVRDYVRLPTFEAAIGAERDAIRRELEADTEGLKAAGSGLRSGLLTEAEAAESRRLGEEYRLRARAFEEKSDRLQRQLIARMDQLLGRLLDEIDSVVRDYGKKHSYDVILREDDPAELDGRDGELVAALRDRLRTGPRPQVAFHSDAVDITEAVQRELNAESRLHGLAERDGELGLPGRGPRAPAPLWPHLAALAPPAAWEVELRPGAPGRRRWHAEVTVHGLGDATGPTGVTKVVRLVDDQQHALELVLPPLPMIGPFVWALPFGARVRVDVFRRRDGERQGTAVALRELPSGRLLLFYDDGILPPCGVEDMDDIAATLTALGPEAPKDAWAATTLRLDRGNDSVTLRDDEPPALLGRSGLVARVVRARIRADERIGAWLVWRPAE